MRKPQGGNAATYMLMCLATVAVTAGVAIALFPEAERTPTFVLSLVMLCFAEATLFAFPVYHGRAAASRSAPSFAFGFGFQAALALYAVAVVMLCLLSGIGTIGYSLVERPTAGTGMSLQSLRATGGETSGQAFDDQQQVALARQRALPAGMQHSFEVEAAIQGDPAAAPTRVLCEPGRTAFQSRTEVDGDAGSGRSQDCLGSAATLARVGDLEVRKTLLSGPTPRANAPGVFDLKYRVDVHNTRWFTSFRTLAIAHTVLLLLLLLTAGFWHMGSGLATRSAQQSLSQRQAFLQIQAKLTAFATNVALDRSPAMKTFLSALKSLNDDVTHATRETLPGTESYNETLLAALARLDAEYGRVRAQLAATTDPAEAIQAAVQGLVDQARSIGNLVRERDAAIRAAR